MSHPDRAPNGSRLCLLGVVLGAVLFGLARGGRHHPRRSLRRVRVRWDGRAISGIIALSGLELTTEVVEHRAGAGPNLPHLAPGKTSSGPLVLTRPRTADPAFEDWARLVWNGQAAPGAEVALRSFRKDIVIEVLDHAGQVQVAFRVYRCWPSHYAALGAMQAGRWRRPVETLTLQYEGWERDETVGRSHPGRRKAPEQAVLAGS